MKKMIVLAVMVIVCIGIVAVVAGDKDKKLEETAARDEIVLTIQNSVENRVVSLGVDWKIEGEARSSTAVEIAGGGEYLEGKAFHFRLEKNELGENMDYSKLSATVRVLDKANKGSDFTEVANLKIDGEFGKVHTCELCYDEATGYYVVSGEN